MFLYPSVLFPSHLWLCCFAALRPTRSVRSCRRSGIWHTWSCGVWGQASPRSGRLVLLSAFTGTGYHFNGDYDLDLSNHPVGDYPLEYDRFNGQVSKARFSITGGMLFRTIKPLWFYVGTGYSYRSMVYGTYGGYWLKPQANCYSSVAIEAGLIYNFHRVVIAAGFSTIGFSYIDGRLGIGFTF